MKKILWLTLHRKWFDLIAKGEKREEYRDRKEFWDRRLVGRHYDEIHFRNGYSRTAPSMRVEYLGLGEGQFEGRSVHVLKLGRILEIQNWP